MNEGMNAAARLVFNLPKFSHVTPPLFRDLHWLPVAARIKFKTMTLRARLSGDKNAGGGAEEDQEDQQQGEEREAAPAGDTGLGRPDIYKAVFSYQSRDEREMSFREGDLFDVITSRDGDWWAVRKVDPDGRALGSGYVPGNFLKREESVDAQPWYFGKMSRFEAQSHLMCPENKNGAFLVRLSQKGHVGYVLSVKQSRVKHFKVFQSDSDFWVEKEHVFCSLADLVNFYQSHQFSTREPLGQPCKRMEPHPADLSKATVDEWELPKEEFTLQEQLGSGYFADVYRGLWKNQINVAVKVLKAVHGHSLHFSFSPYSFSFLTALSNQEVYQKVASGYRMPCPSSCPNFIYSLMLSCWHAKEAHRPDFKELYDQLCTINSYDICEG
ncbi:Protein-tyrosine kinase 6 [Merluccius polli]|uniref:Tyrosine-protein kinase n=1 Tax=Merluccius polli TaxID=89951 RepID=A0AA47NX42_MERPO|nr:Protein-tyrosine kinase 6 [Merluccius polli]